VRASISPTINQCNQEEGARYARRYGARVSE
jgi:hypothetical protein